MIWLTRQALRWAFLTVLALPAVSQAQYTYSNLYSFGSVANDGLYPNGLTLVGSTLYGTTQGGGSNLHWGTIFAINTDGTDYSTLYNFKDYWTSDKGNPHTILTLGGSTYQIRRAGRIHLLV